MAVRSEGQNWLRTGTTVLVLALLSILIPQVAPEYITILLTRSLIFSIAALSLNILVGYTGLGHIGYAAFFAIGGYATAILAVKVHAPMIVTLPVAIALAAAAAAIAALLLLRASGLYFLIISLAIAMCIWGLIYRWVSLTGGDNGITGIPRAGMGIPWDVSSTKDFYYFILIFFLTCLCLIVLTMKSPYGKTLLGIRDSEPRMRVLGFNVWFHKYLILVITGGLAGLAGNLYAYYNTFIAPNVADLGNCMDFVLMVIIGGPGTILGPIIGSIVVVFLKELVSVYTSRWLIFLGVAYILTAVYAPEGIVGLWYSYRRGKDRVKSPEASA